MTQYDLKNKYKYRLQLVKQTTEILEYLVEKDEMDIEELKHKMDKITIFIKSLVVDIDTINSDELDVVFGDSEFTSEEFDIDSLVENVFSFLDGLINNRDEILLEDDLFNYMDIMTSLYSQEEIDREVKRWLEI